MPLKKHLEKTPSTLGVIGGLASVVGLAAIGAHMLDLHGHCCEGCGHRWKHFGAFNLNDEESHRCSRCGTVQWWKDGAPHVMHGSTHAPAAQRPPQPAAYAPAAPQPFQYTPFPPPPAVFAQLNAQMPPLYAPPMASHAIAMGGYAAPTGLPHTPSTGLAIMRRPR